MSSRLGDRLSEVRHQHFVGRVGELTLFRSALVATELPFYVLYVSGPGGVGKTTLLQEFMHICHQARISATYLDARDVDNDPESFLKALQLSLGLNPPQSLLDFLSAQADRHVLLIDTYETLAPLDRWFRQSFLPELPDNVLTILAGQDPPPSSWRADPAWQTIIHSVSLRNLSPEESRAYLGHRKIPFEQHQAILDFTHGHPLALSLSADMYAQRREPPADLQPELPPDIIRSLLERLVQQVPGPAHRTALEACAIVRVTTETLLAKMLALPDPGTDVGQGLHELFEWLRRLSFIESRRGGLFPHDLVRETLVSDLRWRNPAWYAELHRRARTYYTNRLEQTSGSTQQRVLLDYVFLHRDNPLVRPFFEWQVSGSSVTDSLRETDMSPLLAMVAKHEGQASARLAAHWLAQQPEGVTVYRQPDEQPAGFLTTVVLPQVGAEETIDPAIQTTWRYLKDQAPLRPGEQATLFRFWMAGDTYQNVSPTQSLIFINMVQHYLTTPNLAFVFCPCADPDFWAPVFAYAELERLPEADFEVGGRHYGVYGHDWRAVPPITWLAILAEKEIAAEVPAAPSTPTTERLVVLSQSDFKESVRQALHDFSRLDALQRNPLLRSRLVVTRSETNARAVERVTTLQSLLQEAAETLQASSREIKHFRALYHTYLQPAPTQEQAAEMLDIPFSTFRRHLKAGIGRISELLWQQEIGLSDRQPKMDKK